VRIVYDHSIFMEPRIGGVLRHTLELVRGVHGLPEAGDVTIDVQAGWHHAPISAADLPAGTLHGVRVPQFKGSGRFLSALNRMRLKRLLAAISDCSVVLHETLYGDVFPSPPNVKRVVVVHDTIWEDSDDRATHAAALARKASSIAAADGIIFVSNATRAGFCRHYPAPKLGAVIHHGCELRITRERRALNIPGPFVLYVGQRGGYKNWARFAEAFAGSDLSRSHWLVSFGPKPTADEQRLAASLPEAERLLWRGGTDDELADFYAAADCFVYPSLAEGFGIPLVEAAKLGCPVACSDIPPFREVLGQDAYFSSPLDPLAIAVAMKAAINAGRGGAVVAAAKAACGRYTWHNTAKATLNFYRQVASEESCDSRLSRGNVL